METCYRHPKVETAVSCSGCGRPICPDCMTPSPVGMRCPECAPQRSRATKAVERRMNSDTPLLTYIFIGICVALELGVLSSGGTVGSSGGGDSVISDLGLAGAAVSDGEYYRLLTSGFLHSGLPHLLFNMLSLYILGSFLEPMVGRLRFAIIYFVALLCGSLGVVLIADPFALTVGASGAIFGLMGAAIVVSRNRGFNPMANGLGFWLGLNLLFTFTIPNISIGGHIGGLIGGTLAALVIFELPSQVRGLPRYLPNVLAAGLGAVAIVASIAAA